MAGVCSRSLVITAHTWRSTISQIPCRIPSSGVLPAEGPLNSLMAKNQLKGTITSSPRVRLVAQVHCMGSPLSSSAKQVAAVGGVMHRGEQKVDIQHRVAGLLHLLVVAYHEIGRVLEEAEKAEALPELHAGAGPGLDRGGALAHLLLVADGVQGVLAAHAEIHRDVKPAGINAPHLLQNVQVAPPAGAA